MSYPIPVKIAASTRLGFLTRRSLEITLPKLWPRSTTFLGFSQNAPLRIWMTSCSRMASWIETCATYPETLFWLSVRVWRMCRWGRQTLKIFQDQVGRSRRLNIPSLSRSLRSCSFQVRIRDPSSFLLSVKPYMAKLECAPSVKTKSMRSKQDRIASAVRRRAECSCDLIGCRRRSSSPYRMKRNVRIPSTKISRQSSRIVVC